MSAVIGWLTSHWLSIVPILWSIDQCLKVIGKVTPSKLDDNLADMLGDFLSKFFPQK